MKPRTGTELHISLGFWITRSQWQCAGTISVSPLHQCYCRIPLPECPMGLSGSHPLPTRCDHSWPREQLTHMAEGHGQGRQLCAVPGALLAIKSLSNEPRACFQSEKQPLVGKGEPRVIPAMIRGYGRTRAQGQPMLPASSRSPVPVHYCSTAINPTGIQAWFLQEAARGAGTKMPPGFSLLTASGALCSYTPRRSAAALPVQSTAAFPPPLLPSPSAGLLN